MRPLIQMMIVALLALGTVATGVLAQSPFSPAITVNDTVITYYELDQRQRLLELFRNPGDNVEQAREGLIDDRLKMQELTRAGLRLAPETLLAQMEEFAGRANLDLEQFLVVLGQNDVSEQTLRDFVEVGVSWRDYVRERYSSRVTITEADIDQALGQSGAAATAIEVLLSEIIIAAPPPQADRAMATAQGIAQMTSFADFEAAARQVSALPSRASGGRLDWVPLANFPAPLRPILLALAPGEVTAPLPIDGGIALFQLRDLREVPGVAAGYASIDYAVYAVAGGMAAAEALRLEVDTCDDLYGLAQGQPPEVLTRTDVPPDQIPSDVATVLAGLDANEASTVLTRDGGQTGLFVMLCGRTGVTEEPVDREAIGTQLRNQRLAGYAEALVAELRASAVIVEN
jgi:peptidyl-prolyl cis-trans isomerase SurA